MKSIEEIQVVIFELNNEEFAIDINRIKEIIRIKDVINVPAAPKFVMGISNIRGQILPVIDTRLKLGLDKEEIDYMSRMLVIEKEDSIFGFVVDKVNEVIKIKNDVIEKTPSIVTSIDEAYIEGVIKLNNGERIVMKLNVDEILKETKKETHINDSFLESIDGNGIDNPKKHIEEEQLVTFNLGKEEYAFYIEQVREIIRVNDITPVPNAPYYVKGVQTVRGNLLPIIDLRKLFQVKSLNKEKGEEIELWKQYFNRTIENFRDFMNGNSSFNIKEDNFMDWIDGLFTSDEDMLDILAKMKKEYNQVLGEMKEALNLKSNNQSEKAQETCQEDIMSRVKSLQDIFEVISNFDFEKEQRILVININNMYIGITVDSVNEVKIVQRDTIESIPDIIVKDTKELKSAIKDETGKRLVVILDETELLSEEATTILSDIELEVEEIKEEKREVEEEQYVVFNIENEEYGIGIENVKEINRIEYVTEMPKAPKYIEGMTNLRGELIPLISLRKRFGIEQIEYDNTTRIVIVEIDSMKTGFIVDKVTQIIKISNKDLEDTPGVMNDKKGEEFIHGIAKLDNGKRMIMLFDIEKILDIEIEEKIEESIKEKTEIEEEALQIEE